ncbi:lipopolysaccharide-induced tumor necrosis factor-alpha factor homolog [Eurytemora carolleeae]|uniref:lipopolysaccharide-induced tumor necrosis factor-alpha factor homolog n=1 Tax=Eurytemora carolleeae TaxID=1294199 RepID=UPI000C7858F7|nr:lipopolysaccharide-induced tumor necrosis factor-alpha factor homolog [Eurytemora carolleeae]|eukprot:XP_023324383.1 lipopolysaccharide-induced tumor necrosis factor-alpha factor homolog [Eurytemora affinis]
MEKQNYNAYQDQTQPQGWTSPPPYYEGDQQPTQQQPTTHHTNVVHVVQNIKYGRQPVQTTCGNCRSTIVTATEADTGVVAFAIAAGFCVVGLWCGCCCIPFFMDSLKDVKHTCPNCNALLGTFKAGM